LLDAWALLGRQDLRAAEDTLRRWMAAAALVRSRGDGGTVAVVAESAIPTVQSLIRWDPVGHADAELDARAEVGLPPAVHIAAVDGTPAAVGALLDTAELPETAQLLGPVDLPTGARRPPGAAADSPVNRMLVRVPRDGGLALAAALRRATGVPGNALPSSSAVRRAPMTTARTASAPQRAQRSAGSSRPHHRHTAASRFSSDSGPVQCLHLATVRHRAHASAGM